MIKLKLERYNFQDKQTLGTYTIYDDESNAELKKLHCLELPWKNNERMISCIPEGKYKLVKRTTEKRGEHFHILDVPNRTWILIHKGNFHTHILGCQLPGLSLSDLNKDGYLDVVQSKKALEEMLSLLPEETEIEIINK